MPELGDFLKALRGDLSLREAAKRSGLSYTYIRSLELGKHPKSGVPITPSPESLKGLAKAYNYDYEELLRMAGVLEGSTGGKDSVLDEVINQKVAQLSEETKKHLIRYIDLIQDEAD